MTGTAAPPKSATWNAPGYSLSIEYSVAVLEQIREIAVDGYHRVPHGGVETGGILFGTHQEDLLRVAAWRPIACEYARGPSFLLSEKDEAALAESLKVYQDDAELARLEPVGWYRAHTRSEVLLSDADLTFFSRFFPLPWQVGLIVRPASFAPTRAGFFFRGADGGIHAQSSYLEFTLTPVAIDQAPLPTEIPVTPPAVVTAPDPSSVPATEPREQLQPEPPPPLRHTGGNWKWYAASLIVLAIAALGFWLPRPVHPDLTLSATDVGGQLRIAWDGAAPSISQAKSGSMDIDDHGVRTQVTLTQADLRSGNLIYARQSSDVGIRLTVAVPGSPPLVETTRFLKPGAIGPSAAPSLPQTETTQAAAELPPQETKSTAVPLPAPANSARRVVAFRAPDRPARRSSPDAPGIAPPSIDNVPAAPPPGIASMLGPAASSPSAPAAAPPTSTPASGRIIWTGRLAKNSRLIVERNHASSGAVSGMLPSVASRVSAYPGDLTADGITLFTADPRYSQPLTEKAGAQNGWNSTTYTWDPKRASGIKILEQPGPQNGYKLVLQSDIPKLSVVVFDWRAAP
jgi:proteasome lid subunit RPN8/RPN11